jgi:hypothetical protein
MRGGPSPKGLGHCHFVWLAMPLCRSWRLVIARGIVNLSSPRAIFAGSPPRFTRSRVTYEAYAVSRTSTRPQVDSAAYKQLIAVERGWRDCKPASGCARSTTTARTASGLMSNYVGWHCFSSASRKPAPVTPGATCVTNSTACTWSPWPPPTAASPNDPPSPAGTRPSSPPSTCPNRPATSTSHPATTLPPTDNPAHEHPVV